MMAAPADARPRALYSAAARSDVPPPDGDEGSDRSSPDESVRQELRARFRDPRSSTAALLSSDPIPRRFVVDGLIPAGENCLGIGEGGVGKGHAQIHLGIHLAAGWNFGPFRVDRPQKVILISREDDLAEMQRRLHAGVALLDPVRRGEGTEWRDRIEENFHIRDTRGIKGVDIESPAFHDTIIEFADELGGVDLICIDPLTRLIPPLCKLNDQDGAGRIHVAIDALVRGTGATIMVWHHVSKAGRSTRPGEDRGAGASSGSHLLEDLSRAVVRLTHLPGDEAKKLYDLDPKRSYVELSAPKANYSPALRKPFIFVRELGGALRYVDQLADARGVQDERVFEALAAHPDGLTVDQWQAACADLVPRVARTPFNESRARLIGTHRIAIEEIRETGKRGVPRKIYRAEREV